jgi:hypothetical protein
MPVNPAVIPANPTIIQTASTSPNPITPAAPNHSRHSGICRLPRLRTLELRGYEPPASFASSLDLPSLRELIILCSSPPRVAETIKRGTIELIRKFGDGLTDVLVNSAFLNEPGLLDILEHLPNVVSFRLLGAGISHFQPQMPHPVLLDSVLEKLTPKFEDNNHGVSRATCYCPKLEKFGCKVNHNVGFSEEAFVRFIAARRSHLHTDVAQLTSVVVAFPARKPSKLIRDGLEELGVDLEDMVLITAYMKMQAREPSIPRITLDEFDVQDGIGDHEDWISTVRPFRQMLGDWIL